MRLLRPRQQCLNFSDTSVTEKSYIDSIYVINLDRQPERMADMLAELNHILDATGKPLADRVVRYAACDGGVHPRGYLEGGDVNPFYTLKDQLFVEPQPLVVPEEFDLERPIRMTQAEVAVAYSHIGVWRAIARSRASHALVLEDDVWFERGFGKALEHAWSELEGTDKSGPTFDILYVSYNEVRYGAPKEIVSKNVFRPERGLWYMSGYVLSKKGAQTLLDLLPCSGPIDLWINHKFKELEVRALRRSVVNQRRDLLSTNSYSILPILTGLGILDSGDAALFHRRPSHVPVFAFGKQGAGLSSLAMALSMLGYRCCSDVEELPEYELLRLLDGRTDRIFDAYVNVGSLEPEIQRLARNYPKAKFIVVSDLVHSSYWKRGTVSDALDEVDVLYLSTESASGWQALCQHLRLAPPDSPYPVIQDIGLRKCYSVQPDWEAPVPYKWLMPDPSPWTVTSRTGWEGIRVRPLDAQRASDQIQVCFEDDFTRIQPARWLLRNDTFPGNLGLFRPRNVAVVTGEGVSLSVAKERLGVRDFGAAAITSHTSFLFGRFEVTMQVTNVPGVVTGFFLHRDSPRQEIDVEILGSHPDQLLVNVFYSPGDDGTKYDYGYRGAPAVIKLGFDASMSSHRFAIEWDPCEIRWFVDQKLVHRRAIWAPTPIPHLPMKLHVNTWPSRSREFAGRLAVRSLPASTKVFSINVKANIGPAQVS